MDSTPLMRGIEATDVQTSRLRVHMLESGPRDGEPVVLLHGNTASSRWWEETMVALPPTYRAIAPDLRAYGDTEALPVDATRGVRDWADDIHSLVEVLTLDRFHLAGWSLAGLVAQQYAIDHPGRLLSLTLVSPIPPYGVGGTKDERGTPCFPDYSGSGGGRANAEMVRRMAAGDRTVDHPFSPRNVMNAVYFRPPFHATPEREEMYLTSLLQTRIGDDYYAGDSVLSENWPGMAPGTRGINNAVSPKWCDLSPFAAIDPKPPVLWIRGANDLIVSDVSPFDAGFQGKNGRIPGWPGIEVYPPQPMIAQVRAVLDAYREAGGRYWEHVIQECGHSPHIEKPEEFRTHFFNHLRLSTEQTSLVDAHGGAAY